MSGAVVWFTGLPGSGKTTLATALAASIATPERRVERLDGDDVRRRLWPELGFSPADRDENVARLGRLAAQLAAEGAFVLVSAVSPYELGRRGVRRLVEEHAPFVEAFVATPVEECMARDPKGMYARALAGEIPEFTGVSAPYEEPEHPDLRLDTLAHPPEVIVAQIVEHLARVGIVPRASDPAATVLASSSD